MMSTMAVMGASLEKSGLNGWRCFYSKPRRRKRLPYRCLARDAARRIV
jgi:hypothetical protein